MLEARNLLLKATQQITYRQEISYLKNSDKFKKPAIVRQLKLCLDDEDLLRCCGRLQYTDLPYDAKFPILMTKDNYLTTLVQSMHKTVMHGGVCTSTCRSVLLVIYKLQAIIVIFEKAFTKKL